MAKEMNPSENETFFSGKNWYAVHTRSRHEKSVSKILSGKGIEVYLPELHIKRKWSDRIKIIDKPLFSGYTFIKSGIKDKDLILATRGVVRILGMYPPEPIPEEQINTLRHFEGHDIIIDPFIALKEGSMVKVRRGPLKGCAGVLIRKERHHRLVVSLKVLMQSASVEIDADDVEKIY